MAGKQAKTLSADELNDLPFFAQQPRHSNRNVAIVLLRAAKIAKLTWDMVLDATGHVGAHIELRDHAAKKGSGRKIPYTPILMAL